MAVFSGKLDKLATTLELGLAAPCDDLATRIRQGLGRPAYLVGSGGSVVAAEFAAQCRRTLNAASSVVQTPLDFVVGHEQLRGGEVWLFSARGENADILAALTAARERGAQRVCVLTARADSRLATRAETLGASVFAAPVADERDGFLATHSLAASIAMWWRACDLVSGGAAGEAGTAALLVRAAHLLSKPHRHELRMAMAPMSDDRTLILLADPRLSAAAVLIETSAWEGALAPVQRTDFRNFAHGRHVWLAQRPQTMVLALTGDDADPIWRNLADAMPAPIPRVAFNYGDCGRFASAIAVVEAFAVVEALGIARGIDPGKPGVGTFGPTMYDDDSLLALSNRLSGPPRAKRNAAAASDEVSVRGADWSKAQSDFRGRLAAAVFGGVVLDFDGTLVTAEGRYKPPTPAIVQQLVRLIEHGVCLGVGTGRGGSAGETLRAVVPAQHHPKIAMAYYNGGYLCALDVDIRDAPAPSNEHIASASAWLDTQPHRILPSKIRRSGVQITIELGEIEDPDLLLAEVLRLHPELTGARSKHSLDIYPISSCKTCVVDDISIRCGADVLCIGDNGQRSGNDHALLGGAFGVSVGTVCDRRDACWALFGEGLEGPDAVARILGALQPVGSGLVRLDFSVLGSGQ